MKPYIVCTGSEGRAVVFGYTDTVPVIDYAITLHRARMVPRWDAACGGLFGLAAAGPKGDTRLTQEVETTGCIVAQFIAVAAGDALSGAPTWTAN